MNLVKVYNAKDTLEANIITDILNNNDIPCHIQDAGAGEYLNIYYGFTVYGKDIYVNKEQFDEAKALIDEIITSEPEDTYADSNNSSDTNETTSHIPWYYKKELLVRAMFLIPVVIFAFFALLNILGVL